MSKKFTGGGNSEPPKAKAISQLITAFTETYQPIEHEEMADEVFSMRRLRDYFGAQLIPKMPDPIPPYLDDLEKRGYKMRTTYEGYPAIFVVNVQGLGRRIYAEEISEEESEGKDCWDGAQGGDGSRYLLEYGNTDTSEKKDTEEPTPPWQEDEDYREEGPWDNIGDFEESDYDPDEGEYNW